MPTQLATTVTLAGAPKEASDVYHRSRQQAIDEGVPADKAHARALRMVHHAGWYLGKGGWKRIHPDLRDKISVRDPIKQPDGKFVIEDVDVFYPNAAKSEAYDAARIEQCVANTNKIIADGGQRPGLIEGHPPELPEDASGIVKAQIGGQFRPVGYGVNWRLNPNRPGWARCDLVDVDPAYVDRQRRNPLSGLSAGIAKDAAGLKERFAHVASLGSSMQSLAHLPRVELSDMFSANQICFSADAPPRKEKTMPAQYERIKESELARGAGEKDAKRIAAATYNKHHPGRPVGPHTDNHSSEKRMPLSEHHQKLFADMSDAYAAQSAAYKSYSAGEPGCEDKMKESNRRLHDLFSANAQTFESAMPDEPLIKHGEHHDKQPAEGPAVIEDEKPVDGEDHADHAGEHHFAADNPALQKALADNKKLQEQVSGLVGQMTRKNFAADVEELRRAGHELPGQEHIDKMFNVCFSADNPKQAIDQFLGVLKAMPKRPSPAGRGVVLGAAGADAMPSANGKKDSGRTRQALQGGTMNFSSEDIRLGELMGGAVSTIDGN